MGKFGTVLLIIIFVVIAYLLVIVAIPFLSDVAVSTNTTMAASSNMSNYPGTSDFLLSIPWIMYFVPAAIGTIAVIITLKGSE